MLTAESDHVVELQMVQKVADDSKLCDVLEALHKVDKDKSPEKVLESAKDSFNGTPNVFFLSKKVLERVSSFPLSSRCSTC